MFFIELWLTLYHSIALFKLYNFAFESVMIGRSIEPPKNLKWPWFVKSQCHQVTAIKIPTLFFAESPLILYRSIALFQLHNFAFEVVTIGRITRPQIHEKMASRFQMSSTSIKRFFFFKNKNCFCFDGDDCSVIKWLLGKNESFGWKIIKYYFPLPLRHDVSLSFPPSTYYPTQKWRRWLIIIASVISHFFFIIIFFPKYFFARDNPPHLTRWGGTLR